MSKKFEPCHAYHKFHITTRCTKCDIQHNGILERWCQADDYSGVYPGGLEIKGFKCRGCENMIQMIFYCHPGAYDDDFRGKYKELTIRVQNIDDEPQS